MALIYVVARWSGLGAGPTLQIDAGFRELSGRFQGVWGVLGVFRGVSGGARELGEFGGVWGGLTVWGVFG